MSALEGYLRRGVVGLEAQLRWKLHLDDFWQGESWAEEIDAPVESGDDALIGGKSL
jgi:hypothetical protein